jgi:ketosteroid isomerase-like protein
MVEPVSAGAGSKEDAFQVIEQFNTAFDASDVQGIVKPFARDVAFLGTVSPKVATTAEDIDAYFQGIKRDTPRKITIGDYSTLILSDAAVIFAGFDVFARTKDGKVIEMPPAIYVCDNKGRSGLAHQPLPFFAAAKSAMRAFGRQHVIDCVALWGTSKVDPQRRDAHPNSVKRYENRPKLSGSPGKRFLAADAAPKQERCLQVQLIDVDWVT